MRSFKPPLKREQFDDCQELQQQRRQRIEEIFLDVEDDNDNDEDYDDDSMRSDMSEKNMPGMDSNDNCAASFLKPLLYGEFTATEAK